MASSFEIGTGRPFTFSDIVVGKPMSPAFPLSFTLAGGGTVASSTPLFTMTLSGEFTPVPEPTTLLLLASGLVGIAGIALRARRKH